MASLSAVPLTCSNSAAGRCENQGKSACGNCHLVVVRFTHCVENCQTDSDHLSIVAKCASTRIGRYTEHLAKGLWAKAPGVPRGIAKTASPRGLFLQLLKIHATYLAARTTYGATYLPMIFCSWIETRAILAERVSLCCSQVCPRANPIASRAVE
jgi:hypothetical protein